MTQQLHVEWDAGLMAVVTPTGEVVGYLKDWLTSHDRKWRTKAEEARIRADERRRIAEAIRLCFASGGAVGDATYNEGLEAAARVVEP